MTNFIKKIIATFALGMALTTPLLAAECAPNRDWVAATAALAENKNTVVKLNEDTIKTFVDKIGPPPHADGKPFDAYVVSAEKISAVFVVQEGCIVDRL